MIIDSLANAKRYTGINRNFAKAFDFIASQDLKAIEVGKYPVDGTEVHASVSLKEGVKQADAKFEAHNNYIDIQVCPSGSEEIGWSARENCSKPVGEYNSEKDVTFFDDKPEMYFTLHAGQFAVFFPEDVHAPMIGAGPVKKLVVKVKL